MISIGTVLYTKDGRRVGNGIILDCMYGIFTDETFYMIRTDFGNILRLTEDEVKRDFYLADYKIHPAVQLKQQTTLLKTLAGNMKSWL